MKHAADLPESQLLRQGIRTRAREFIREIFVWKYRWLSAWRVFSGGAVRRDEWSRLSFVLHATLVI